MLFLLRYVPKQHLLATCVVFWLCWLLVGSLFYSYNGEYYWTNGFYMAVNVGYSIGWGYPGKTNIPAMWFSIVYVMMGVVAISGIIGIFTDSIIEGRKQWVAKALQRKKMEVNSQKETKFDSIKRSFFENYHSFLSIIVWFL
jgi:hypothetical protein